MASTEFLEPVLCYFRLVNGADLDSFFLFRAFQSLTRMLFLPHEAHLASELLFGKAAVLITCRLGEFD